MLKIRFKILNRSWVLKVLDKKKYNRKNGKDSVAMTKSYKRTIELSPKGCDKETIIHELVHAYLSELCVWSADLDVHDLEEVYCEILAKRGLEILQKADKLLKELGGTLE